MGAAQHMALTWKRKMSLKKKNEINANTSSAAVKVLIPKFRDLAQAIANEG